MVTIRFPFCSLSFFLGFSFRIFTLYQALASKCVGKLSALAEWLSHQKEFRFYATSLVLFLDAADPSNTCDCRWGSFSSIVRCQQDDRRPASERRRAAAESSFSKHQADTSFDTVGGSDADKDWRRQGKKKKKKKADESEEAKRAEDEEEDTLDGWGNDRRDARSPRARKRAGEGAGHREFSREVADGSGEWRGEEAESEKEAEKNETMERGKDARGEGEEADDDDDEDRVEEKRAGTEVDQDVNEGIRRGLTTILDIAKDCLWG